MALPVRVMPCDCSITSRVQSGEIIADTDTVTTATLGYIEDAPFALFSYDEVRAAVWFALVIYISGGA